MRDHVSGREAAKIFSMIGLIMVAAPAFAPSIGSLLLGLSGWNLIFLFLGGYGLFMMIALKRTLFTLLFGANILIMTVMNLTNRVLLNHYTPRQILRFAISLQALGILTLLLILIAAPRLEFIVPAFMLSIGAMGAISPNNQASCMEYFPTHSGRAIVLAMAACSALCLILVWSPFRD